MNKQAHILSMT